MQSNQNAVDGNVITYTGGTFGTISAISEIFVDGEYEVYLISGYDASVVGTAAIPEPSGLIRRAGYAWLPAPQEVGGCGETGGAWVLWLGLIRQRNAAAPWAVALETRSGVVSAPDKDLG
ncbi:hypothetical protein [Luteolibacter sp. AS25]|uniref:hypothetical protein n=1 Tax=Luteolibacter sp. AS25 TaxID=3135776 RepID=UPI00398B21BC